VVKDIPDYAIAGENPARVIKYKFDEKTIEKTNEIKWWEWDYRFISDIIPIIQSNKVHDLFDYYQSHMEETQRQKI